MAMLLRFDDNFVVPKGGEAYDAAGSEVSRNLQLISFADRPEGRFCPGCSEAGDMALG
jgi:hypothetical protein